MTNPKGTFFETLVVNYLQSKFPGHSIERRAKHGSKDQGDISGLHDICIEVKNCKKMDLAGWVDQAVAEAANCEPSGSWRVVTPIVIHKRLRKGKAEDQYVTMRLQDFLKFL